MWILEAKSRVNRRYVWQLVSRYATKEAAERMAEVLKNPSWPEVLRVREEIAQEE